MDTDLSFLHLQVELLGLDLVIHRAVRLWQRAHGAGTGPLAGQYISDAEISAMLRRPLGAVWWHGGEAEGDGGSTSGSPGEGADGNQAALRAEVAQRATSLRRAARVQGITLRLDHLAAAFALSPLEVQALLLCVAPALDRRYERFFGYLQDDATRRWPTASLLLDLLCPSGPDRLRSLARFEPDAPLQRAQLLRRVLEPGVVDPPLLNQALRPDETLVSWLLGRFRPHADLGAHATLVAPQPMATEARAWVAEDTLAALERIGAQTRPILVFHGRDAESQWMAARALADRVGRSLLRVNVQALLEPHMPPATPGAPGGAAAAAATPTVAMGDRALRVVRLALRDARLSGAIPYLAEWDTIAKEGTVPPEVLRELAGFPRQVILAGKERWLPQGADPESRFHWLEFRTPAYVQRRSLWRHLLTPASVPTEQPDVPTRTPKAAKSAKAVKNGRVAKNGKVTHNGAVHQTPVDVDGVAGQFVLTASQIRDSVIMARDIAAQRDGGDGVEAVTTRDLFAAARAHASPTLGRLARRIVPRYGWDDLILPADQVEVLRELAATVRARPKVLEEWGVGAKLASSAGVTVLFSGPPGTGKTMSAEVLAAELGLDLYKIELSTVVSKYIGETEKNLEQVFREAETSNAILFFDEADAIFGKRSEVRDAHDRYANIEISYLLQRMESYDGVTILATNLRANLDAAFTRRLQFVVDMPFPEEEDRLRIWQALLPDGVPCAPDVNLAPLANRFKLAGGNIRNIIMSATYQAAADGGMITNTHLLHGVKRELQKMGRLMKDGELAR